MNLPNYIIFKKDRFKPYKTISNHIGQEIHWCSVQRDWLDKIDKEWNNLSFVKDIVTRFLNEAFILNKALV